MQYEIMTFEDNKLEIIEFDGKILFNPYHVAKILDIKNVRDNISKMNENQVVKLTNSDVGKTDIRKLNNAGENFLTECGVYKLVFKSRKENAERFQDWVTDEVLPSIRKTGTYTIGQSNQKIQSVTASEYIDITKSLADWLQVNEASKIQMITTALTNYNLPTNILPKYVESKGELLSCTECLKRINANMSTRVFNLILLDEGYLEEHQRPSTHSETGMQNYKVLTEKGLEFGENQVNPNNPTELQPMYYIGKFQDLYNIVTSEI